MGRSVINNSVFSVLGFVHQANSPINRTHSSGEPIHFGFATCAASVVRLSKRYAARLFSAYDKKEVRDEVHSYFGIAYARVRSERY